MQAAKWIKSLGLSIQPKLFLALPSMLPWGKSLEPVFRGPLSEERGFARLPVESVLEIFGLVILRDRSHHRAELQIHIKYNKNGTRTRNILSQIIHCWIEKFRQCTGVDAALTVNKKINKRDSKWTSISASNWSNGDPFMKNNDELEAIRCTKIGKTTYREKHSKIDAPKSNAVRDRNIAELNHAWPSCSGKPWK